MKKIILYLLIIIGIIVITGTVYAQMSGYGFSAASLFKYDGISISPQVSTAILKLNSVALLSSPQAGALEFLTDKLYFTQTSSSTRKELKPVDMYYGEMYEYENTASTTIGTQSVYHAVDNFSAGLMNGFSLVSGIEGTGTITDNNGVASGTVLFTDTAHGLLTGDIVTVHSSTNYNGTFTVTKVSANTFTVTSTYVSDQAADWAMGSYLLTGTGSDGVYSVSMSNTSYAVSSNTSFTFEMNKNTTPLDNISISRKYSNTDYGSTSSTGLVSLSAGDRLWLSVRNDTSATDLVIRHANINIKRL